MRYDFDQVVDRRGTLSLKWQAYGDDVLPLWVADMDFVSAHPVVEAVRRRAEHGVFGYSREPAELRATIQRCLRERYQWDVATDAMVFLSGTVIALNFACRAYAEPGGGVAIQTPIYPPFLSAPGRAGARSVLVPLVPGQEGYEIDYGAFERAVASDTRLFLLCNPHNPTGRVFTRRELEQLAEICLRHDIMICSDEVHYGFVYDGHRHIPIASLSPEVAARTITLMSPSKTFNIPGLHVALAVITDPALRTRFQQAAEGVVEHSLNVFAYVAALAAYRDGDDWLLQVLDYLRGNRDLVVDFTRAKMPGARVFSPEGTYLAWLDFREAIIGADPAAVFLHEAKVALSPGTAFGDVGAGFARLNFACSRDLLQEGLRRMAAVF